MDDLGELVMLLELIEKGGPYPTDVYLKRIPKFLPFVEEDQREELAGLAAHYAQDSNPLIAAAAIALMIAYDGNEAIALIGGKSEPDQVAILLALEKPSLLELARNHAEPLMERIEAMSADSIANVLFEPTIQEALATNGQAERVSLIRETLGAYCFARPPRRMPENPYTRIGSGFATLER